MFEGFKLLLFMSLEQNEITQAYKQNVKNIFIENFLNACYDSRMSDNRIAEVLGMKYKVFYKYKRGEKYLSEDKIYEWCIDCGIRIDFVFNINNKDKSYKDFIASQ